MKLKYVLFAVGIAILGIGAFAVSHKVSPVVWNWWGTTNTSEGFALHGYDAVSYFETGEPADGAADYTFEWNDAIWRFSSKENRDRFAANPENFAPQFGGFCAFAVSKGFTADSVPQAWHIEDGKLYVFADKNVRDEWTASISDGLLDQSHLNWSER